jgi:hypothetical protein
VRIVPDIEHLNIANLELYLSSVEAFFIAFQAELGFVQISLDMLD